MRPTSGDAYGRSRPEVLVAVRIERRSLEGVRWLEADATQVVNDAATDKVLLQKGATEELTPLDLGKEPEVKAVVDAVGFEDLLGG